MNCFGDIPGGKRPGAVASAAPLHVIDTCAAPLHLDENYEISSTCAVPLHRDENSEISISTCAAPLHLEDGGTSLTPQCCIYRVPKNVRKVNKEAYTPQLVSIGPFHRDNEELKSMDQLKKRFMERLVQRSGNSSLKSCFKFLEEQEKRIRVCYSEQFEMKSDEFVEMILVDGCFIVELLNLYYKGEKYHYWPLSVVWGLNTITLDLILLENQIPFFVLEGLFTRTTAATSKSTSFLDLSLHFFKGLNKCKENPNSNCEPVKHFTDLVLTFYRSLPKNRLQRGYRKFCCDTDLVLPLFRSPAQSSSQHGDKKNRCVFSSTELDQAGVTFKRSSSKSLFDIHFAKGVLHIPSFTLDDNTETQIRNIMALELCHYSDNSCVTDYMIFMDRLINTTKDVNLLVKEKIIFNYLGDNQAVANHFNNLCINVTFDDLHFNFSEDCEKLNAYYEVRWHSWKATLKREYFCTPWRTASTIAAILLLVLTFIQTVISIISIVH